MNIYFYEQRDDSLMLNSLLTQSAALGILTLIMFASSTYFKVKHNFHSVLALVFFLAVPATIISAGTLSVALSNGNAY